MVNTNAIRRWFQDLRWRLDHWRDALIDRFNRAHEGTIEAGKRASWKAEGIAASLRSRREQSSDDHEPGFLRRAARSFRKDADSVLLKPRVIAAGMVVLLASGFLVGFAVAPRGDFEPSGLNVLPQGSWQNLPSQPKSAASPTMFPPPKPEPPKAKPPKAKATKAPPPVLDPNLPKTMESTPK